MRIRTALSIFSAMAIGAIATAQSSLPPALHVGDKAPALPIAGVIKGDKTPESLVGKVTVIEFWATWCGPCIASMPHLSDMADKYKGKASFYSVNTWDFNGKTPDVKETMDAHVPRVAEWVKKNTDNMRYNIVQDSQDDKISTSWMFAAGQYGIPCAFIVDESGTIAWIGHPMEMEKPLEQITSKTFDKKDFASIFNPKIDAARVQREQQLAIVAAAKAGDTAKINSIIENAKDKASAAMSAISYSARYNPSSAVSLANQYYGKAGEPGTPNWASIFVSLSASVKTDEDKATVAKLSEANANAAQSKSAALVFTYHARVLNSVGKKDAALAWIEKAKAAIDTFEPAAQKDAITKFIDQTAKTFKS